MKFILKHIAKSIFWLPIICLITSCSSSKKTNVSPVENNILNNTETQPGTAIQKKYGNLLGVSTSHIQNGDLYNFIDKWMGVPYKIGGQTKDGIDCSGFAQLLFDAVYKLKLPRTSEAQYTKAVSKDDLQEGDLVFYTTIPGKKISHVGIYLQNNKFVSATSLGVTIADMNWKYWKDRFVGGGRVN